jgi:hypothetical protein
MRLVKVGPATNHTAADEAKSPHALAPKCPSCGIDLMDVATLYYALARYGGHDSDDSLKECASTKGGSCDCGYQEALEFAKESINKRPHSPTKTLPKFLTLSMLDALFAGVQVIGKEAEKKASNKTKIGGIRHDGQARVACNVGLRRTK